MYGDLRAVVWQLLMPHDPAVQEKKRDHTASGLSSFPEIPSDETLSSFPPVHFSVPDKKKVPISSDFHLFPSPPAAEKISEMLPAQHLYSCSPLPALPSGPAPPA